MAITYRYHVGSLLAVFLALLLGVLIGIGLTSSPEEFEQRLSELRKEQRELAKSHEETTAELRNQLQERETIAKEAAAWLIADRLRGKRVAIILNHDFGSDPLPDNLRALMKQAGATVTSTTTITSRFVNLTKAARDRLSRRLLLYPPPGTHFRSVIAQTLARDLARGRTRLIGELRDTGLVRTSSDANYSVRVDCVVLVGGLDKANAGAVERIDLPLIDTLLQEKVRVVGCESTDAKITCIPAYESKGIPTVDNVNTLAGRLALVLVLAGADGNYGVKETADRLLPPVASAGGR